MLVNYMITRCDHIFHVGKDSALYFGFAVGSLSALPYKLITLTLVIGIFSLIFIQLNKSYQSYKQELETLPKQTQSRVKSATKKHHDNLFWWRCTTMALALSASGFFIIEAIFAIQQMLAA